MKNLAICIIAGIIPAMVLPAQQGPAQQSPAQLPFAAQQPGNSTAQFRPTYVLGPGDVITLRAFGLDEISDKPFRIDSEGDVNLAPVLGKVHAAGLTVEQFEADLLERFKTIQRNPQVTVTVSQFRIDPVYLVGAFKNPGMFNLEGRRTLRDVLTSQGGLAASASRRLKVTRQIELGRIPLPNAVIDADGKSSSVEISLSSLMGSMNPAEDIVLQPFDKIQVDRAEPIYVTGEVNRVGAVDLGERDYIYATQLITSVGGLGKEAAPEKARVLRPVLNTAQRAEIPVDLKKILSGQGTDFPLMPNDVLYVPRSSHKVALGKVGLIALPMATSFIYILVTRL
jgi:polysaccharide biosynthesis/export protein